MNKYLIFLFIISLTIILCGCENNKEDEPSNVDYYVKYEANVKTVYVTNSITYIVNTESGLQTFKTSTSFSQTFGPFKKGFETSITADASILSQADCNVRIYVCRGSEPFALKASNAGGKKVSASYTIDY